MSNFPAILKALSTRTLELINDFSYLHGVLDSRYGDDMRRYHTYDHILKSLEAFQPLYANVEKPVEFEIAILFHDIIYEIGRKDNEHRSLELLMRVAHKMFFDTVNYEHVEKLILATQNPFEAKRTYEEQLFVDIDMHTLGLPLDEYEWYQRRVRSEYLQVVTPEQYNTGRIEFLKKVLAMPMIFQTCEFVPYQQQARINILKELDSLHAMHLAK